MKNLRDLQRQFDQRRDPDDAVRVAVTEYHKRPSPEAHARIIRAVQHLVRASGGVHRNGHWRAP